MRFLPTQVNQIMELVEASPFRPDEIQIDQSADNPVVRFTAEPKHFWFHVLISQSGYNIRRQPGENVLQDHLVALQWSELLRYLSDWLRYTKREHDAAARAGSKEVPPAWATDELPHEYRELIQQVASLEERVRRMHRMSGL